MCFDVFLLSGKMRGKMCVEQIPGSVIPGLCAGVKEKHINRSAVKHINRIQASNYRNILGIAHAYLQYNSIHL